jgi:hypothetical protein
MEFSLDCFMRVREQKLTWNQLYEPKTKTRRSLTILTDSLFPTERIEKNPAIHSIRSCQPGPDAMHTEQRRKF